ncbi:sugar ABC transporter ATP-binding protein [Herbiconiux sp. KACC 21604]|uniref:sugar ABC transporter ATP-binding protein n=1 Tax=unclassified Herbiconiux TaxID=2618217 RepID=UPI0014919845|nr:sugar ABC transporter ATP-binding protein [Herbiconiux sp. SALV-R1]QJU54652.1 sugar ABC transporter ATP-binding protein [Herbiconiux sp. SALV-R1]WPO85752.1 sugar ABC transporter ATP-binding protein [Herbiconiux sp. KACC 21604]
MSGAIHLPLPVGELVALPGEVLVAVGENRSGLAGVAQHVVDHIVSGPRDAAVWASIGRRRGLVPGADVAQNVFMGRERRRRWGPLRWGIDERATRAEAAELLAALGSAVSPLEPAEAIGEFDRIAVELARALAREAVLVALDEPTADLGPGDAVRMQAALAEVRRRGVAVVVFSERPRAALAMGDRVVVVRDGAVVGEHSRGEWEGPGVGGVERMRNTVLREMVARPELSVPSSPPARSVEDGELLAVSGWTVGDPVDPSRELVHDVGFSVRAGEVLGIAGLRDSGASPLLLSLYGHSEGTFRAGRIEVGGREVDTSSVEKAIAAGLFLVATNPPRYRVRFIGGIAMPVSASSLPRLARMGLVDRDSDTDPGDGLGGRLMGAVRSMNRGGAQADQLLGLLREFPASERRVLLLDDPSHGLDTAQRAELHRGIERIRDAGKSVVFTSDDLIELYAVSDRILVMADGRITGTLDTSTPLDPLTLATLLAPH